MTSRVETRFGEARQPKPALPHRGGQLPQATSRGGRFAGLDLLRFAAAVAVVLFHFGFAGASRGMMQTDFPALAPIALYGFVGVELFFLISGFVIMASVSGRTWTSFAFARVLRLYPAHVVCMTATALVVAALGSGATAPTIVQWLANLTMVAPAFGERFMDGAYWSIVVEIIFYGWIALFLAMGLLERRLLTLVGVWLAIAALNEYALQLKPLRAVLCTEFAPFFAIGMLVRHLMATTRPHRIAWVLLAVAFALGGLHALENQRIITHIYGVTPHLPTLLALHVAICGAFTLALWASQWITPTRAIALLGGITYPLYLVHQNAGYVLVDALAPALGSPLALIATLSLVTAFSGIVYMVIEPSVRRAVKAFPQWHNATSRSRPLEI